MNKGILIGAGILVVLVLSLPLLAALKKQGTTVTTDAQGAPAAAGIPSAPEPGSSIAEGPTLSAASLPGTSWEFQGYQATFQQGGQVAVSGTPLGTVNGSWTVSGTSVTISAVGQSFALQISGAQLLADGQPLRRLR